jgi:hypothetical protein
MQQNSLSLLIPSAVASPGITSRMCKDIALQKQLINDLNMPPIQAAINIALEQLLACRQEYERTLALFN